jgi:hypothetical protein
MEGMLMRLDPFALVAAVCFWGFLPWAQRLDPDFPGWLRRLAWCFLVTGPVLAVAGPGLGSAVLAAPAVIFAVWLLVHGVRRFLATDQAALSLRLLGMLAATGPLVAAAAWVWSRYDRHFAGFPEPLATLTTVHFSMAFGVLPLAMSALEASLRPSWWRGVGIFVFVLAAPATAFCFALRSSPMVPGVAEVGCAAAMAAGFLVWAAGLPPRTARWPLVFLTPGILLGAGYTAATGFGWRYLTIPEMAVLHGLLNLTGSLLLVSRAPALPRVAPPAPDLGVPVATCAAAEALFVDDHRQEIGLWSPEAFARIRGVLLAYRFYPDEVMVRRTQFEEEGRALRVGDRLGLGLFLPSLPGLPPFLLPAVVEVHVVEDAEDLVRLGYRTTRRHYGRGEWLAEARREGDRMVLQVRCHIRPSRWFVWFGLPVYRRFQLAAFRAGLSHLRRLA